VEADLIRLAQVIANLLTNAAKYTDEAGKISVCAAREGEEVVLRVVDTGVGIALSSNPAFSNSSCRATARWTARRAVWASA